MRDDQDYTDRITFEMEDWEFDLWLASIERQERDAQLIADVKSGKINMVTGMLR